MAVAPQYSAFEILDLRLLRARDLAALFQEELQLWREQLYWDYQPSVDMIRKQVEAHNLPGYAALSQGRVAGYCFFVHEDYKGLIGNLYVLEAHRREWPYGGSAGIATLLLEHALETLEHTPVLRRIEAQLIPFGTEPLAPVFLAHDFRSFPRLFMYKELQGAPEPPPEASLPVALRPWDDSDFAPLAELIVAAYRHHVDSQINDHYSTSSGALRFLKNIVIFPGCGVFQREGSLVAVETRSRTSGRQRLVGAVLTSQVAPRIGHITQICVRPDWKGKGLGRSLMLAALNRLAAKGYRGVSLTVTAENEAAVKLYRQLKFDVIKGFAAFARTLRST